MMLHKIGRVFSAIQQVGYYRTLKTMRHRLRAQLSRASTSPIAWQKLQTMGFDYHHIAPRTFVREIERNVIFADLIARADRYIHNCFEILGAHEQCFNEMPWYRDVRLYQQNPDADSIFDAHSYFKDITITVREGQKLGKDIKVPWELARFTYAPILGLAYGITKNDAYAHAAQQQISSWLDATHYGYGIHWFNGMEVSIRAVNWIMALQWLSEPFCKDAIFYQRLICSLYDHMRYIEKNWEWYDGRTNNHYLTNLIGYAYLCWFFKTMPGVQKKWDWCYQELLREFDWQVFDEGTSYEGSTRYHSFVTELFLHGFLIAREMGIIIEKSVEKKLVRMFKFIEACTPTGTHVPIIIGDDDSGALFDQQLLSMHHFRSLIIDVDTIKQQQPKNYYQQFGISLINQKKWHISLRHHAYSKRQPTGHFHRDGGSVTIAYNGTPIIVDPGTYVYTASSYWRNYFRSAGVHNTISLVSVATDTSLFTLPLEPVVQRGDSMTALIQMPMGVIERTMVIEDNSVRINDHCMFDQPQLLVWNFIFAPEVMLVQNKDSWQGLVNQQPYFQYLSSLPFKLKTGLISPRYGVIKQTQSIQALQHVTSTMIEHLFIGSDYS